MAARIWGFLAAVLLLMHVEALLKVNDLNNANVASLASDVCDLIEANDEIEDCVNPTTYALVLTSLGLSLEKNCPRLALSSMC